MVVPMVPKSWFQPKKEPPVRIDIPIRTVHGAQVALRPPPAFKYCIPGLLGQPSLNLLVGDPGHKKSLLATDLAISVAMGKPWLNLPVIQQPVLLVEEESGFFRLWKRLNSALTAHAASAETPFHFISMGSFDFRREDDMSDLTRIGRSVNAGLIVIDALANIMVGGDENSVTSVQPILRNLRSVALGCSAALLIIHHTNKSGGYRGSTSLSAGVDHMLSVYSPPGQDLIRLKTLKSRDTKYVLLHARANFKPDRFHLTFTDEKLEDKPSLNSTSLHVLRSIANLVTATTQQLMDINRPSAPTTTRKIIYELLVGGYIKRADSGRRGKPATYQLSDTGRAYLAKISGGVA